MSNEKAQNMNLNDTQDQARVFKILEECVRVIDQNSNKLNAFPDLYYETYNNMARCMNIQGNIRNSLEYLMLAMTNVETLAKD